jgi:hypothetical protein
MKNLILLTLILLNLNLSFAQKNESKLLKKYDFYIEKEIYTGKWSSKYYLSNGLVVIEENYWKNELRSRKEFEYDDFDNIILKTKTYDINVGTVNIESSIKLEYKDSLLIKRVFDYGIIENYSDFNEFGKPKLIERIDGGELWPYKEIFEYDEKGNVVKSIEFYTYSNTNNKTVNEKATTYFKYDKQNNVIEIHREFEPKQDFPIIMIGGPNKYEFEYFRYKYNKDGLWIKKFKTINGIENLFAIRKYK